MPGAMLQQCTGGRVTTGGENECWEWMTIVTSFVASRCPEGLQRMSCAAKCAETIHESGLDLVFGDDLDKAQSFSAELEQLLLDRTHGMAWDIVDCEGAGNRLESNRQIRRHYEPRTAGTKRAALVREPSRRGRAEGEAHGGLDQTV